MDKRNCARCDYYYCGSTGDDCILNRFETCYGISEKTIPRKLKIKKKYIKKVESNGELNHETESS